MAAASLSAPINPPLPDLVGMPAATPAQQPLLRLYGSVALLHLAGGTALLYGHAQPALIGLGLTAYLFGVRHAFDADHIAAIDDTVRLMLQQGRKPLGAGFFFALGHSSVVLLFAVAVVFAAGAVKM